MHGQNAVKELSSELFSKKTSEKFFLLLWKNSMLHKRHKMNTIAELLLPILLSLLLLAVRAATPPIQVKQPTTFRPVDVNKLPLHAYTVIQQDNLPVVYSPDVPVVNEVVEIVANTFSARIKSKFGFSSEEDMEQYIKRNSEIDFLAGVVFENMQGNSFPKDIRYKIRLKTKLRAKSDNPTIHAEGWLTQQMYPMFPQPGPRSENDYGPTPNYYSEGFVTIQHAVAMAIISLLRKKEATDEIFAPLLASNISLQLFPVPAYRKDEFIIALQTWLPVIIMLSFLYSSINIIKSLVQEKENKIKESLKMMGLSGFLHWSAWYAKSVITLLFPVIIMTFLLTTTFTENVSVIAYSDSFVIFSFLLLYTCTTIMFCFAISVFFSRASSAVTAAGLIYFFSYVPYMYIHPRYILLEFGWKLFFCILPNTAMAFGGQFITMYEGSGIGLQWSNFNKGATPDDNLSMAWIFIMLIIDFFFYFFITWYVDNIYPGEFGVPKPWYFPLSRDYWGSRVPVREIVLAIEDRGSADVGPKISKHFESDPINLEAGIQIRNLTKVFNNKIVVNNITLNMYKGQITVLLGHNGAGKTTTMSMLTGLLTPSKGTAYVGGFDIQREITGVRSSLGLCPQHDVLFPELTVEEHLRFFHKLKGAQRGTRELEVNHVVEMLHMDEKRSSRVATLSAGLKRKLSVGIALIGGSKVVLLDEPTSGMDPAARRETWELLQKERIGRTILLTTHFMDEADILGDRVAIMVSGQVKCCGSPLFLKRFYGLGFRMVIVKTPKCNVTELSHVIRSTVAKSKLTREVGSELMYILPQEKTSMFASLFEILESKKEILGIASFGVSMTTMEDVFFSVGQVDFIAKRKHRFSDQDNTLSDENMFKSKQLMESDVLSTNKAQTESHHHYVISSFRNNKGIILILQQLRALFVKRMIHSRRNYGLLFIQLALPIIFVSVALILAKTAPKAENEPLLQVSINLFPDTVIPFYVNIFDGTDFATLANYYTSQITDKNQLKYVYDKNVTQFLLDKAFSNPSEMRYKYTVGASFINISEKTSITAYYGDEAFHSAPVSIGLIDTALFRYFMGSADYSFTVINHPLPTTLISKSYQGQSTSIGFDVAFNLVFGASLLASSFVIFVIKERQTKAKHLQFISGINTISFWLSSFVWDYVNFLVPCFGILLLFRAFNQKEYTDFAMQGRFLLVFTVYGWSVIPLMYILSFLFDESSTGFTNLSIFNAFTGMGTFVATIMLYLPQLKIADVADLLQWIFLPLPNYSLAWAFFNLYKNYVAVESCTSAQARNMCKANVSHPCCLESKNCGEYGCLKYTKDFFDWKFPGIGRPIFFMEIVGCVAIIFLFLIEFRVFITIKWMIKLLTLNSSKALTKFYKSEQQSPAKETEDDDVAKERQRIEKTAISELIHTDSVIIKQLTKHYGSFVAVDNISIGIARGECFGLLGTTGAGKTTIFDMLTGDTSISKGEAYLEGYSVIKDIKKVQQQVGYCPQFDAIIDQMTGRETLTMFARLRGIPEKHIPTLVENLAAKLMFTEHIDKQAKNYSGGNRRKLSTAVAMVGSPLIVFLDEPTTGVDPVSRRMLWDGLSKLRDTGCSITLTTHSMDECEALCTRLAILQKGRFRCLGSPQHLKSKFGCSYTLIAKVQQPADHLNTGKNITFLNSVARLCDFINKKFSGSELREIHQGMVYYVIENPNLSLASIFSTMEKIKQQFNLEDYSISQTTLEDVFLNFIKEPTKPPQVDNNEMISLIHTIPELAETTSGSSTSTLEISNTNFQSLPFLSDAGSENELAQVKSLT